jgi:hypothetical protein
MISLAPGLAVSGRGHVVVSPPMGEAFKCSTPVMTSLPVKRVAVIGAGPAGAISLDALAREKKFDIIRVFERREGPGGCWCVGSKSRSASRTRLTASQDRGLFPTAYSFRFCLTSKPDGRWPTPYSGAAAGADPKVGPAPLYRVVRVSVPGDQH